MKTCICCKESKDLGEFYKAGYPTGIVATKCKVCAKAYTQKRYSKLKKDPMFMVSQRKRGREKYERVEKTAIYRAAHKMRRKNIEHFKKYPEKQKAKNALKKVLCLAGMHRHHWSYNKEHYTDVIQLTPKQHYKAHRFLVYDQSAFMYRDLDGNLLDTKSKHLAYIVGKLQSELD